MVLNYLPPLGDHRVILLASAFPRACVTLSRFAYWCLPFLFIIFRLVVEQDAYPPRAKQEKGPEEEKGKERGA